MAGGITKEDLVDVDIVDAVELASTGSTSSAYQDGILTSVVSGVGTIASLTNGGLQRLDEADFRVQSGDIVTIQGATAGNGDYTVNAITGALTFTVNEAIVDSTGGTVDFRHPSGAFSVGIDAANHAVTTATDLQTFTDEVNPRLIPDASQLGDLLVAEDGASFTVENPVVSKIDGWLTNDDGELIVEGDC